TAWSSHVIVKQVRATLKDSQRTFHDVAVSNLDSSLWDWPPSDRLMWIVDDAQGLRCRQRPYLGDEVSEQEVKEIKEVFGCHECGGGSSYLAVRWEGYEGPTWELESRL
ncbi:hypothetical protein B0T10DRAFT_362788, partial [Thelonectria olida]